MMGRRGEQWSWFYQFRLDERVPKDHLLRRIDRFVTAALADIHERLEPYYSDIGRPSVDPELMIRMLIVGYCYGLRSERRLTQEVELHLDGIAERLRPCAPIEVPITQSGSIPASCSAWKHSPSWYAPRGHHLAHGENDLTREPRRVRSRWHLVT